MAEEEQVHAKDFEEQLAEHLRTAGYQLEREPAVDGFRPDFIVSGPEGRTVVVEAKSWAPSPKNADRAAHHAKIYGALSGVEKAFVVVSNIERSDPLRGVVAFGDVIDVLSQYFAAPPKRNSPQAATRRAETRSIFAAMPFSGDYDDTYLVAMTHAAAFVEAACKRVDHEDFSGDIVEEITRLIRESDAVIVDLSEGKPNVLYEAGFAHALNKPVVHISSTPLAELPFDIRNWNTIAYSKGRTSQLKQPLARRLAAVLPK